MHSRAFQLTEEKLLKDQYINAMDLYYGDGMPIPVADYIEDSDREEDIKWLLDSLKDNGVEGWSYDKTEQSLTFTKAFITSYFELAYKVFKKKAEEITLEDFSYSFGDVSIYQLTSLIEEKDGFYVFLGRSSTGHFRTLDSFVRSLSYLGDEDSVTFYIGGTLDYRC